MAIKRDRNEEPKGSNDCKRSKKGLEFDSAESDDIDDEIRMDAKSEAEILDATFIVKGLINDDDEDSPYFLGITAMLNNITSIMGGSVVSSDLAKLITDQGNIGGVIAQEGDGADDDIFGYYSILSLAQYADTMKRFINYIKKMVNKKGSQEFKTLWNTFSDKDFVVPNDAKALPNNIGLWLCHKAQNTPIPVILDVFNCVLGDVEWSLEVKDPEVGMSEEERVFYNYSHIMTLIPVHLLNLLEKGSYKPISNDDLVFNSIDHELMYKAAEGRLLIARGSLTEVTIKDKLETEKVAKAHDYLAVLIMKMEDFKGMPDALKEHVEAVTDN